jgi:hypothetical protein
MSFISENSGKGSSILFDYYLQFVVDKISDHDLGRSGGINRPVHMPG